jgi:hypothetical protein
MANIIKRRHVHSDRIERWLGPENIARAQKLMLQTGKPDEKWYGPPIYCIDIPGNVWLTKDGDFIGDFNRGVFHSAYDAIESHVKRFWREIGRQSQVPMFGAGFASISDALARASSGSRQYLNGTIIKAGSIGVASVSNTLWRVGSMPAGGAAGSAAPGGRACSEATTGAMLFDNPASGTLHLTGADMSSGIINNTFLLYDRIFDVAKTMNSTATEAVTGVPTRYQSSTSTAEDYAGGNFLFVEVGGTALAATAHNWTTCLYRDEAGNDNQTLPSLAGVSGAIVDRFDHPANQWFAPLASGDVGIMDLAQMQCSAAVATGLINFVIGHPIGFMFFNVTGAILPFDWLTNKDQAPRIFNDACLAGIECIKSSTAGSTYTGRIHVTNAAP